MNVIEFRLNGTRLVETGHLYCFSFKWVCSKLAFVALRDICGSAIALQGDHSQSLLFFTFFIRRVFFYF